MISFIAASHKSHPSVQHSALSSGPTSNQPQQEQTWLCAVDGCEPAGGPAESLIVLAIARRCEPLMQADLVGWPPVGWGPVGWGHVADVFFFNIFSLGGLSLPSANSLCGPAVPSKLLVLLVMPMISSPRDLASLRARGEGTVLTFCPGEVSSALFSGFPSCFGSRCKQFGWGPNLSALYEAVPEFFGSRCNKFGWEPREFVKQIVKGIIVVDADATAGFDVFVAVHGD